MAVPNSSTAAVDPRQYFERAGATLGATVEAEPVCLYLETTNRCNLLCTTCPRTYEALEQGLLAARQSLALCEIDQPLQMDLADPERVGQPHEGRQLRDRLLEAGQPERHLRRCGLALALEIGERPHIAHDPVEHVAAADQLEAAVTNVNALSQQLQKAVGRYKI